MKSTFVGTFTFFGVPTALGLLFILASLHNRSLDKGTTTLDAVILPAYLMLFAMTGATIGFVIVTAMAPVWRRLTPKRSALIAGPIGLTYTVFYLLGLAVGAVFKLLPIYSGTWLAAILMHLIPGAMLGLIAILIATLVQQRTANNRINSDWQFRCTPLPAGYAERWPSNRRH
jgi:hypothetical protein